MSGRTGEGSFILADHLGSTSLVTDAAGTVIAEVRYTPYGETRFSAGTSPTDYLYTSQRQEAGLGLYFYNARWFDPYLARFTQADTIVPVASQGTQAWDRYAYTNNNPLRYTDPTGHCVDGVTTLFCIFVAAMVVGAVVDASVNAYNQYQDTGHVDAGEVFTHAWEGALIGGGVVIGVAAAVSLLPVTAVGTAACADGDCGNEIKSISQSACSDGDCGNETSSISRGAQQFWNRATNFNGTKVFQRDDLVDPSRLDSRGRTSLELMQKGQPAIGPDNKPLVFNHLTQTMDSTLAEVTQTMHTNYFKTLHINTGELPSLINRAVFGAFRNSYWIERSKGFLNKE